MHEVKDDVYNVMKQTGRKNPFKDKDWGEKKGMTVFLKWHRRLEVIG